ncbi:MAG: Planctomycete cytochrome [Verrucomicrobiales bacterium]|nr:Planctomycete cytochrome [Verrucomicrobiales bacterium]
MVKSSPHGSQARNFTGERTNRGPVSVAAALLLHLKVSFKIFLMARRLIIALFAAGSICITSISGMADSSLQPRFETDIRPILKAHCFDCHGEGEKLSGGVDLRLRHFMIETKTDDGMVVVPEKPDSSVIVKVIESGEMPKKQKSLSTNEMALIRAWIATGALTVAEEPHELPKGFLITEQERGYWAFQAIVRPPVPAWTKTEGVRTSIDVFVLQKLREQHLDFAAEADKLALIRRVYFDLLGLPPPPEEVDAFLADGSPDAYERLVDRVLEMPEYGERWGRHWLDTAGYSDSNGYAEADSVRAHAWRYRDYVIRAMNTDKPWNDFIIEQMAGDELAGVTQENAVAKAADSRVRELLVATDFLRMGPDGTGDDVPDQNVARNQTIAETLKIVSSSLLGLSIGCAQCHDHRYDPISQVDYYRMRSIFEPALDWKNWRNPAQQLVSLYTADDRKKADVIEADARKIDEAAGQMRKEFLEKVFEKELSKLPEEIRESAKAARNTAGGKRTPEQVALLKKYPSADVQGALDLYDPESNKKVLAKQDEATKLRATKPPEPFLMALTERSGKVPETFLFNRGDHEQPKQKVEPGELQILQSAAAGAGLSFSKKDTGLESSGRRLIYAKWLVSGRHPLTARVLVNRFWLNHFGCGLVNSPGEFGKQGERPTHPELLDWLASEFMANGWKLKPLHRLIMTSAVYRQSSHNDASLRADPDNRFYGRMKLQRFDAETLRDSILAVSGKLNKEKFGPALPIARDDAGRVLTGEQKTNGNGDPTIVEPIGERAFRRSIYVESRRSLPLTVLEAFDEPVMSPNCAIRQASTVAPQSLMMLNDTFIAQQAQYFAEKLQAENPGDVRSQLNKAWRLVYGTAPKEGEVLTSLVYLAEQGEQIRARIAPTTVKNEAKKSEKPSTVSQDPQTLALASLCQALISANRFIYIE